jgi:hypothetical protein
VLGRQTLDSSHQWVHIPICYDSLEMDLRQARGDDQRRSVGSDAIWAPIAFEIASGAYAYMDVNHLPKYLYPSSIS